MSERDIRANILAFREAAKNKDDAVLQEAGIVLLEVFLLSLQQTADALTVLAEEKRRGNDIKERTGR